MSVTRYWIRETKDYRLKTQDGISYWPAVWQAAGGCRFFRQIVCEPLCALPQRTIGGVPMAGMLRFALTYPKAHRLWMCDEQNLTSIVW